MSRIAAALKDHDTITVICFGAAILIWLGAFVSVLVR